MNHTQPTLRKPTVGRRDFCKLAAAALAGPWLAGAASRSARAGDFTGRIKKAVQLHMVSGDMPLTDKFKLIQDLGFDGVEISGVNAPKADDVLKARDATGLTIHGVTNGYRTNLCEVIDEAKRYGGIGILKVPGAVSQKVSYDENYRTAQLQIRAAAPHAEKQQIKILVENVWNNFLLSPMETARFIDECQNPWVGAYFDVGNVLRYGWPDQWIRILGHRIGKIHIKDFSIKKAEAANMGKGYNVAIGDGDCDWPAVCRALADIHYAGWATAEVAGGDRRYLADVAARMDRVLQLGKTAP